MTKQMSNELKPCPFCGGEVIYRDKFRSMGGQHTNGRPTMEVVCLNCEYSLIFDTPSFHKQKEKWNTRND